MVAPIQVRSSRMAMEKHNVWSASADKDQLSPQLVLELPPMSALGRKRPIDFVSFRVIERPLYLAAIKDTWEKGSDPNSGSTDFK